MCHVADLKKSLLSRNIMGFLNTISHPRLSVRHCSHIISCKAVVYDSSSLQPKLIGLSLFIYYFTICYFDSDAVLEKVDGFAVYTVYEVIYLSSAKTNIYCNRNILYIFQKFIYCLNNMYCYIRRDCEPFVVKGFLLPCSGWAHLYEAEVFYLENMVIGRCSSFLHAEAVQEVGVHLPGPSNYRFKELKRASQTKKQLRTQFQK